MPFKINIPTIISTVAVLLVLYLLGKESVNNFLIGCNERKSDKYEKQAAKGDKELRELDSLRTVLLIRIALDSQRGVYEDLINKSQQVTENRKKQEAAAVKEREVYVKKNKDTNETIKRAAKRSDNKQLVDSINSIRARLRHLSQE